MSFENPENTNNVVENNAAEQNEGSVIEASPEEAYDAMESSAQEAVGSAAERNTGTKALFRMFMLAGAMALVGCEANNPNHPAQKLLNVFGGKDNPEYISSPQHYESSYSTGYISAEASGTSRKPYVRGSANISQSTSNYNDRLYQKNVIERWVGSKNHK